MHPYGCKGTAFFRHMQEMTQKNAPEDAFFRSFGLGVGFGLILGLYYHFRHLPKMKSKVVNNQH